MLKSSKLYLKGVENRNNSLSINQKGLINGLYKNSLYKCIFSNKFNNFKEFSIQNCLNYEENRSKNNESNISNKKIINIEKNNISEKNNKSFEISKFMPSNSKETNFTSNSSLIKYSNNFNFNLKDEKNYSKLYNENKKDINLHFKGIIKTCKNIFDDIYEDDILNNLKDLSQNDNNNNLINHIRVKEKFLSNIKKELIK